MRVNLDGVEYNFGRRIPLNAERSYQFMLLRYLLGLVSLQKGTTRAKPKIDHSIFPGVVQERPPAIALKEFMRDYGMRGGPRRFIRITTADNRSFYQNLLAEFSNYEIEAARGSHTSAFIFLYRILERMSFSVPLLYCSTSRDYTGTFNELRAMFSADSDKSGEHGFFKKFLSQGRMIDREILESPYSLSFSASGNVGLKYFRQVSRHSENFFNGDESTLRLEIMFKDVPDLIRNVRNRFFHARTGDGQKNISLIDIHDAHGMFACLNVAFANFVALVVLHALAHRYGE